MPEGPRHWRATRIVITCEHAGNEVPPRYAHLFTSTEATAALASHRGWDPGSLGVGLALSDLLGAPLLATTTTRLLVEPNRSPDQPDLFSRFTRDLPQDALRSILEEYYLPHRLRVEGTIRAAIDGGERVLHLGVHSFTDVLDGDVRAVDIGLLFDPDRPSEASLSGDWQAALLAAGERRVRFNEPYQGTDDGLTTYFRTLFAPESYAGLEIELRQGMLGTESEQRTIAQLLASTLPK